MRHSLWTVLSLRKASNCKSMQWPMETSNNYATSTREIVFNCCILWMVIHLNLFNSEIMIIVYLFILM